MPAFRIHLLSGQVVTIPTGQFESVEQVHEALHTMEQWSPLHIHGTVSATLIEAGKLDLKSLTGTAVHEICLARDAVMAVERI